jgi:hypothetical protein
MRWTGWRRVAREQADAVICTGDLTMRGTSRGI